MIVYEEKQWITPSMKSETNNKHVISRMERGRSVFERTLRSQSDDAGDILAAGIYAELTKR